MMLYSYIKFWNSDWVREMSGCPETTKGVGVADHNCTKCNQIYMYMPMTLYTGSNGQFHRHVPPPPRKFNGDFPQS